MSTVNLVSLEIFENQKMFNVELYDIKMVFW